MATVTKPVKNIENLSPEEAKALKEYLGRQAVEVKAPKENYLEGKEAINKKPRGKVVKGGNNWFLDRKW